MWKRFAENDARPAAPTWALDLSDQLTALQVGGYHASDAPATEPTALAALAILARDKATVTAASQALSYLNQSQAKDGSVGVRLTEATPGWPTSLAVLAWEAAARLVANRTPFVGRIASGVAWILNEQGKPSPRDTEIGHDTSLIAWSWAANTHSWIEPTALHVLALKSVGKGAHPRVREAITLLIDRQLPGGGCNYGNTYVLGQMLRPHLLPSGLLALALANEIDKSNRLEKTLDYLAEQVADSSTPISLCWALLGLAAHRRRPRAADRWLQQAYERVTQKDPAPYKLALIAHALLGEESPLIKLPHGAAP